METRPKAYLCTKNKYMKKKIKIYRLISTLEAISFLVLLGIAMPLKYIWDMPRMVTSVGMIHGILFIVYVLGAFYMQPRMKWNNRILFVVILCSVLPFGPFYVEQKYLSLK